MVLAVSTKSAGALYWRNSPGTPTGKKYALLVSVKSTVPTRATATGTIPQSDKEHLVRRLRLLLGQHGAAQCHDDRDDAIDPLSGLVLGGLEVAGRILGDGDVRGHPAGDRVAAVAERLGDDQLLQLPGRRCHGAEALAELDHGRPSSCRRSAM